MKGLDQLLIYSFYGSCIIHL